MTRLLLAIVSIVAGLAASARADDAFAEKVDLTPLRAITVQHRQTLKTLDSWARQTVYAIHGRYTLKDSGNPALDGRDPLFTVLDMSFRPEEYQDLNIIRIRNVPLRQDFALVEGLGSAEKDRILKKGTISLKTWMSPEVQQVMQRQQSSAAFKMEAIGQLHTAAATLGELLLGGGPDFPPVALIPPATASPDDHVWRKMNDVIGNSPRLVELIKSSGRPAPPALPNYDGTKIDQLLQSGSGLIDAWRGHADAPADAGHAAHGPDAAKVNAEIVKLATLLPEVNPVQYPSAVKRSAEVYYNRLAKLTLPGAFMYFAAFVCFLMSARSGVVRLRVWGLRFFFLGLLIHTAGIGIRWWLVEKSVGNWFEAIPIKNQFESVLFSAFFGCVVGLVLALWRRGAVASIIGAAASFVGWMSLVAIFSAPYVFGRDIGGEISQVAGVLMSYWLYIHVTVVTASYALIGMSFLLGLMWLWNYYREYGTVSRLANKRALAVDERQGFDVVLPAGGGGAGAMSVGQTIASMLFFPVSRPRAAAEGKAARAAVAERAMSEGQFLRTIDACNVVVLQLAFWLLGVGIILGAVWADQSWGRPWGWDPKETFALVTWIVYLIVVHVRITVENKGWWTAVLSIVGFFVMLFNWVGVNFFLVGLHSYA